MPKSALSFSRKETESFFQEAAEFWNVYQAQPQPETSAEGQTIPRSALPLCTNKTPALKLIMELHASYMMKMITGFTRFWSSTGVGTGS